MMTCPCRNVAPWEVRADSIFPPFLARKYWVTVKWVTVMQESFLDHLQIERQSRFSLILDTGAQESTAITDTHFCALACSLSKEANARPRSKVAWAFSEAVVSLAWNRDQNSRKAAPFFSNFMICPFFFQVCSVVLVSVLQHCESAVVTQTSPCSQVSLPAPIPSL